MFGSGIWDKLPAFYSRNFKTFKNHEGDLSPKSSWTGFYIITASVMKGLMINYWSKLEIINDELTGQ